MAKSLIPAHPSIRSRPTQSPNIWRCAVVVGLLACLALSARPGWAAQSGVSIESFRVVKTDPAYVEIELVGSNDGSQGELSLAARVKSKDGSVRSVAFEPVSFPAGQTVHVSVRAIRPAGLHSSRTDTLMVLVYQPNTSPLLRAKFEWHHLWPAISAAASEMSFGDMIINDADLSKQAQEWAIFHDNLEEEDFAALDLLMEKWNTPKERDQNGDWKLDGYRLVLGEATDRSALEGKLQRILRWKKANPKSAGAAIAEARYWAGYAWRVRGCRCKEGSDVDPVAMKVFRERMQRAEQALLDAREFATGNPLWYETYLEIAIDSGYSGQFIDNLFAEAIRKHPLFQPLYVAMAGYWAPWNGSNADWEKVDTLVNLAVSLTSDTDGQDNYAWLYAQISAQHSMEVDILKDSQVSWPRMRESFKALTKRYPSADNLNEFAAFACRAGDKNTYLNVIAKIQGRIAPNKWPNNYSVDLCNRRFMQES